MSTKADKKKERNRDGVCKLTGIHGRFVVSHVLPRALTLISRSGEKVHESGLDARPKKRPPTWYDDQLVIAQGEKVLEDIDTTGIKLLRQHKLVWSAFPDDSALNLGALMPVAERVFIREITLGNAHDLRLFFLSIAWRAAASLRPEFRYTHLPEHTVEDLRQRILAGNPGSPWDYPIVLDQIIDKGDPQNRTPIVEEYGIALEGVDEIVRVNSIRIYMDGLVAWVLIAKDMKIDRRSAPIYIGAKEVCVVVCRHYEGSRTASDLVEIILDAERRGYRPR